MVWPYCPMDPPLWQKRSPMFNIKLHNTLGTFVVALPLAWAPKVAVLAVSVEHRLDACSFLRSFLTCALRLCLEIELWTLDPDEVVLNLFLAFYCASFSPV
jgi:hypothetical protein